MPFHDQPEGIGLRGEDLAGDRVPIPAVALGRVHDQIEKQSIALHLIRLQLPYPVFGITGTLPIELIRLRDGEAGQFRVIRQIRRSEEPRPGLHRGQRVDLSGPVNPGTNEPVGVIDTQAVELPEHPDQPMPEKTEHRAGAAVGVGNIAGGIENRVIPRLAFGIGAAGGSAQHIAGEQEGVGKPGIAPGKTDLQIAEKFETQAVSVTAQLLMLPVQQKLGKGVRGDRFTMFGKQGAPPGCGFPGILKDGIPELTVDAGLRATLPIPPTAPAIVVAQGFVQTVPHEPAAVALPEKGKLPGELRHPSCRCLCLEPSPRLPQDPISGIAGIFVDHPLAAGWRPSIHQLPQGLLAQQLPPGLGGER